MDSKYIELLNAAKEAEEKGRLDLVKEAEQLVLQIKDAELSFAFATRIKSANVKAHEKVVIASRKGFECYMFAQHVKGANVKALEKAVIKNRNYSIMVDFATNVEGADIRAIEKALIRGGAETSYECLDFAKRVKGANIKDLAINVTFSREPAVIFRFAKEVPGADIKLLGSALAAREKEPEYNYRFATEIEGADKFAHGEAILRSRKGDWIAKAQQAGLINDKLANAIDSIKSKLNNRDGK